MRQRLKNSQKHKALGEMEAVFKIWRSKFTSLKGSKTCHDKILGNVQDGFPKFKFLIVGNAEEGRMERRRERGRKKEHLKAQGRSLEEKQKKEKFKRMKKETKDEEIGKGKRRRH